MRNPSLIALISFILCVVSLKSSAATSDKNSLLQIAEEDKLVLLRDLDVPANTERLYFGLEMDSGYKKSGCALVLDPSVKSRKIPRGGELIFSGVSHQQKAKTEYGTMNYTYQAEIMSPSAIKALECYGTSLQSTYQDLYVGGMKQKTKETFEFVPADPEIIE